MTNEQTLLLASMNGDDKQSPSRSSPTAWKTALLSFAMGVLLTLGVVTEVSRRATADTSMVHVPMLGKTKSKGGPPLHYFAKASTDFAGNLPPLPPNLDDSFLADLATSTDKKAPITSGFYRQEAGEPLVYEYTYHEMKFIVAGEFHISDGQGNSVVATAGDVFYFPKGSVITFSSPTFGLGFFCGQRPTGDA